MQQFGQDIVSFLSAPFAKELDLFHLFLLIGIILIFIAVWLLILNHVQIAALGG